MLNLTTENISIVESELIDNSIYRISIPGATKDTDSFDLTQSAAYALSATILLAIKNSQAYAEIIDASETYEFTFKPVPIDSSVHKTSEGVKERIIEGYYQLSIKDLKNNRIQKISSSINEFMGIARILAAYTYDRLKSSPTVKYSPKFYVLETIPITKLLYATTGLCEN